METLRSAIPYLVPIIILELVLMVFALLDLRKRRRVAGEKWIWVLVIVFVQIVGPILYFVMGRKEE